MDEAKGTRQNGGSFKSLNGVSTDPVYEGREGGMMEEGIELSLGLSMNGRFGVDPIREKLRRTTSLSNVVVDNNSAGNGSNPQARAVAFGSYAPPMRTSSLPSKVETQEQRRQEVIQSPMPMENLKNPMVVKENGNFSGGLHVNANGIPRPQEATHNPMARSSSVETNRRQRVTDMPYVSTRGFGPNNSQINGFLYCGNGGIEDVKIVCVCHGLFLSPAEFVKHGGGGDVRNPLRHIVVTSIPFYD
ncbi:hypothetical protein ACS0TY_005972 [Phlomoides rotata]